MVETITADARANGGDKIAEKEVAISIKLSKPIMAHGEELEEVKLREPTVNDFMRSGYPVLITISMDGGVTFAIDAQKMTPMISNIAGIPPSSVRMLKTSDYATLATWFASFFTPDWARLIVKDLPSSATT